MPSTVSDARQAEEPTPQYISRLSALPKLVAFSAATLAVSVYVRVFGSIFVPTRTMSLHSILRRKGLTSSKVLGMRYGLHVFGVNAKTIAATVIDFQSFRDWTYQQLIGEAMSTCDFLSAVIGGRQSKCSVAILSGTYPSPAGGLRCLVYEAPEADCGTNRLRAFPSQRVNVAVLLPAAIMHEAQAASPGWLTAIFYRAGTNVNLDTHRKVAPFGVMRRAVHAAPSLYFSIGEYLSA